MLRRLVIFLSFLIWVAAPAGAAELDGAMRDVERLRGVTFKHEVSQKTIERADLRSVLRREIAKSLPYPAEDYVAILRAMQLVDAESSSSSLIETMLDLYEAQVLAFYDPLSHTYFAINELPPALSALGGDVESLRQSVVVHELMHALQDQRFGASKRDRALRRDTDAGLAYHALLEGEASVVMMAWLLEKAGQSLDSAVKNDMLVGLMAASAAADRMIDPSTPRYFVESLKFPYSDGMKLVIEGYRRAGWKEIDRMHANPPRSTREVLHTAEYFARLDRGEKSLSTFNPRTTDRNILSVEHLGEFHWRFLVGDSAIGWVDDRVTVRCNQEVVVWTKWENAQRATAFRDAYVALLRDRGLDPRVKNDGASVDIVYRVP